MTYQQYEDFVLQEPEDLGRHRRVVRPTPRIQAYSM
jgi:hypothetical protein